MSKACANIKNEVKDFHIVEGEFDLWANEVEYCGDGELAERKARKRMIIKILGEVLFEIHRLVAEIDGISTCYGFNSTGGAIVWWNNSLKRLQEIFVKIHLIMEIIECDGRLRQQIEGEMDKIGNVTCCGEVILLRENSTPDSKNLDFINLLQNKMKSELEQLARNISGASICCVSQYEQ